MNVIVSKCDGKEMLACEEVTKNTPYKQSAVSNTVVEGHYIKACVSCMN